MRKDLDEKLQAAFPWLKQPEFHKERPYELVKGYNQYENYGFDRVSDGWYQLIYDLCTEIEEIYKEAGQQVDMKLVQVKSKFGRLRWYYDIPGKEVGIHAFDFFGTGTVRLFPESDQNSLENKIAGCVRKYEVKSSKICEKCGADNAELFKDPLVFGWISTLCTSCREERIGLYNKKMEES